MPKQIIALIPSVLQCCPRNLFSFLSEQNVFPIVEDMKLDEEKTTSTFSACEFDYSSNTYRVQVKLNVGAVTIGQNYITVKVDGCSGMPKVSGVC